MASTCLVNIISLASASAPEQQLGKYGGGTFISDSRSKHRASRAIVVFVKHVFPRDHYAVKEGEVRFP